MKKTHLLSAIVFIISAMAFAQNNTLNTAAKKVVFIIVDGISADQLQNADTPFLNEIVKTGGYSEAYVGGTKDSYSETPTISAVGYNSLLTGTWVNKHNVFGNEIKAPNYHYPTIFKLFKDQKPDGTIAVFSSWLDNRTKLVGDGLKETGNIKVDYTFDGLEFDTINFPHDKRRNFMKLIDYTVADKAAATLLESAPDVSWVYLEFTDDMGHKYGDSDQMKAAIQFEDQLIGKIWNAIKEREKNFGEDWLIVITTDHGRNAKDGKGHGGQTDRERSTWVVTNAKETNSYFKNHTVAVVDILPTMADFLGIQVPEAIKREWDGVSLIKPVDVINLRAKREKKEVVLSWETLSKDTEAKIYISTTNNVKTGGTDTYTLYKTVNLDKGTISIPFSKLSADVTKIILETPNTTLNTWITK